MTKQPRTVYISRECQSEEGIATLQAIGKHTKRVTGTGAVEITYERAGDRTRALEWYLRFCCERGIKCNGVV